MEIAINSNCLGTMPSLSGCCGVGEFRSVMELTPEREALRKEGYHYKKVPELKHFGIGYFVATFVPALEVYQEARRQLDEHHTLVFETPKTKSTSPHATQIGRDDGIVLCVYKWGKEK